MAQAVRNLIESVGVKTAQIERGSSSENLNRHSFNVMFPDKLENGEIFNRRLEGQILIEEWSKHYKTDDQTVLREIVH